MAKKSKSSTAPTAPAPMRTTRQTRSQGVEPAATAPAPASSTDRRGRGAPNSRASSEQPKDDGRKNKKRAVPAAALADLATVEEDDAGEYENAQLQQDIARSQAARRRISTGSAISGTTAKTSFSMEEIELMDPEVMVDVLPDLATAADALARFLAPEGSETSPALWKDVRTPGTRLAKLFRQRQTTFHLQKESFGTQEYIQPRNVLRALLDVQSMDEDPKAPWSPDNILFKINLAEMLTTILIVCDTDEWTSIGSDALERLHAAFPEAIAGRKFSFNTLGFYLDLTAQLTIRRMDASIESEPIFSPHAVVDNLFYDDDDTFRHLEDLGLMHISEQDRNRALELIDRTVEDLKRPFKSRNGAGATVANGKLKAHWRWDTMKIHALKYCEERAKALDKLIAKAGGLESISQALTREVERRRDQRVAAQIRQTHKKHTSTPRASMAGMAALKELEDNAVEEDPAPETTPVPASERVPTPAPEPVDAEPEPFEPINPEPDVDVVTHDFATSSNAPPKAGARPVQQSDLRIASSFQDKQLKRQQKSPQKPRARFIDPQPNAVFVQWDEDLESQQADQQSSHDEEAQSRDPRVSPPKGKRTHAEMEDDEEIPDPTQDEGFQTDTRDMSAANQRRKEVTFAPRPRPTRQYPSSDGASSVAGPSNYRSSTAPELPSQSPTKRQRLNPGSSIVPLNEPAPPGTDLPISELYARAKIIARQHSAVASVHKMQKPRTPWTDEEESALMELIEEHGGDGVSYSVLKNLDAAMGDDARLTIRSAEDIRFKARNMKVNLMVSLGRQEDLPSNWEHVVLGKKEVDKLRQKGIVYVQERQRGVMLGE